MQVRPDRLRGNYVKHHAYAKPAEFDLHTHQSYKDMVEMLKVQHSTLGPGNMANLEKVQGLNYQPHGLLFNDYLLNIFSPPDACAVDSQHILVSSGGVAQYECNCFVHTLLSDVEDMTLQKLDIFS